MADCHLVSHARLNQPQCNRWFWLARLDSHHRVALYNSLSNLMFNFRGTSHGPYTVASVPGSLLIKRGEESLVTSAGKVVDFRCLALAVPIRLQNETTCTHDILSTQQKIVNSINADYNSKVGEKQFLGVQKGRKSRESKIEVHCGWFVGPIRSPYFIAPSLHVQSVSRNSTELRIPRGQRAKL